MGLRIKDVSEDRDGFGNLSKISTILTPTLVIHGAEDTLIPPSDGRGLYDASPAQNKRLLLVPGARHNDLLSVDPQGYFSAIQDFIHTYI